MGVDVFVDGPQGKPGDGVHLLYATEKVRPEYPVGNPDMSESVATAAFRVVDLQGLVRMKLVSNRDKGRTHIRDLIGVGLIDQTWPDRFPAELADRLREILAEPDG